MQNGQSVFFWYDYLLLTVMIGGSLGIGVYFGCFGKKQDKKEYLLGGKSMNITPVAVSLIASVISGITMLSYPADVYKYGSNLIWLCITIPIGCVLQMYIFLPIFFKLQLTSVYEYLELRFDKKCRMFVSFVYTVSMFFYNASVIFIPSIAFSQATNINIHYIGIFICVICIFYTTIGGLKAVVWTDAFQFIGMVVSSVGVVVVGFKVVGGIDVVYNSSVSTNRLDIFDFRFDLMVRYNFWTIIIPGAIHWTSFTIATQGFVQKCLALPTLNKARMAVFIYGFGVSFFILCMVLTGNIMYSKYKNCDPLKSGLVSRHDQLLPYFVIDVSESLPGLVGVFMSGCFCAALSTFSSVLNTLASTIYEDFMSPYISDEVKTKREPHILKLIVLITGILSTLLMIAVEQSSEILPVLVTIQGSTLGPILGLFVLGALIPFVTPQAALYSTITSFVFMLWIGLGNIISAMNGTLRDYSKPISIEGCEVLVNSTARSVEVEEAFILYRISVWYHLTIGVLITVVLGIVLSVFTKSKKPSSNKDLFSPVIHRLLK